MWTTDPERLGVVVWSPGRRAPLPPGQLLDGLRAALSGGVRTVLLREPDRSAEELSSICLRLAPELKAAGGALLLHGQSGGGALDQELAPNQWVRDLVSAGVVHGIHLPTVGPAGDRVAIAWQRATSMECAQSRSVHSKRELDHVQGERSRGGGSAHSVFAFLSPVLPTRSHPEGPFLGVPRARELTAEARLPTVWLGGLSVSNGTLWTPCPAAGIAVLGAYWDDPGEHQAAALVDASRFARGKRYG